MGPHATTIATKTDRQKIRTTKSPSFGSSKVKDPSSAPSLQAGTTVNSEKATLVRLNRKRRLAGGGGGGATGAAACTSSSITTATAAASAVTVSAEPNAAVCDTMAPALNEPLSPNDKLSNSTAKAAPTTRSSKSRAETAASSSSREKRNRNTSTPTPSTSTRVTRSKDAYQRVFEQAVSPTATQPPATTDATSTTATGPIPPTTPKNSVSSNEQMGLSTVLSNNNNNNEIHLDSNANVPCSSSSTPVADSNCKPNSTAQLLADLTNDFEEAITAEICLRKQLREGNLGKGPAAEVAVAAKGAVAASAAEPKDIVVIQDGGKTSGVCVLEAESQSKQQPQHMDSQTGSGQEDTTLIDEFSTEKAIAVTDAKDDAKVKKTTATTIATTSNKPEQNLNEKDKQAETAEAIITGNTTVVDRGKELETPKDEVTAAPPVASDETANVQQLVHKQDSLSRLQILAVEELPPISTDSTMTASEMEDNLEERLSQLDGTAIVSPTCEDTITPLSVIPTTPPRTTTKQQQSHQQQMQQLQQQLQQTPPTPLSQQVQQQHNQQQQQLAPHSFTPQSSSSSVNTLSSANLPPAFMKESAAGELEDQDIEEVLKALKGFDGSTGADTLCDLNVLFNEVYTTLNYEEISSQPASTTTKPNPLKEMQLEIERKQQSMQRKIDILVRRLRKLQARYMSKHTSEEIAGLFEWAARVAAGKGVSSDDTAIALRENINVIAARPPALNWAEEKKNPVPSAQMSTVLRKLELASNAQQLCTTVGNSSTTHGHMRKSKKALQDAQASTSAAAGGDRKSEPIVTTLDVNVVEEMTHVAGLLQTEMREVQNAIDSDATESSSGGESADEMVTYNNQIQQPLSIAKRAAWRYSRDRAAIASRWSWLLSQIADLEIKIRQHSELHQEIVRTKGAVTCTLEEQSAAKSATTTTTSSVNGYKGELAGVATKSECETSLQGACRTRGYIASQFRKRKLFQTTNIHTISKKAARPSTIKCGCQWPLYPCALCTGRTDPTAPRDLPDTMMMADRVALLDPGYHPVLSFPEDVNNAIHFEAIARLPDWQQRIMRCQVKSIAKSVWKAEREAAAAAGHHTSKKYGDPTTKRRYIKKKDRLAAEEKNAAQAAAAAKTTTSTAVSSSTSPATTAAAAASTTASIATLAATASCDAGNGTGTLSTSTTPLVANKSAKNSKKLHYHLVADGILLEPPLSPVPTNNSSHSQSSHSSNSNYIHQTSDYPPQNYDPFNLNPAHSSLISSNSNGIGGGNSGGHKNNKYRKSSTTTSAFYHNNSHYHYNNNNSNSSQYFNANGNNSELNFLHTNDNWDGYVARSRTSSPTHGGSSNYHKYERSKNRSSYDIDNIVIPYSVAAATRVEILPYKEIPTPKWRVIEEDQGNASNNPSTEANEPAATLRDSEMSEETAESAVKRNTPTLATEATTETINTTCAAPEKTENSTTIAHHVDSSLKKTEESNEKQVITTMPAEKKNNNILKLNNASATEPVGCSKSTSLENSSSADEPASKKLKMDDDSVKEKECPAVATVATIDCSATEADVSVNAVASTAIMKSLSETTTHAKRLRRSTTNTSETTDEDEATEEDISDEAMMQRHERALTEERRKFQTYLKFPWSTRSRANRRIDSRAESSGANTPDPTSPAPNTPSVGGGDQESIPSPLAPSTPLNPLDSISEAGETVSVNSTLPVLPTTAGPINNVSCLNKRLERRRTTSTKKDREPERRSSTPDPKELVPPYDPLNFPLSDEAFKCLLSAMPSDYVYSDDSKYPEDCNNLNNKYARSRNSWRSDVATKRAISSISNVTAKSTLATMNCDLNNRRQRINNNTASRKSGGAGGGARQKLSNGKDINNVDEERDEEEGDNEEEMEDGVDYDYPKHHLAPDDDLFDGSEEVAANDVDDEYGAYVGGRRRMLLGDSEGESSETEPFPDDDPNDPEWKGESEDRAERLRKSVR